MAKLLPALLVLPLVACAAPPAVPAGSTGPSVPVASTPSSAPTGAGPSVAPRPSSLATPAPAADTWTQVLAHGDGSGYDHVQGVAHGAAGFVAYGNRMEPAHGGPQITQTHFWTSTDGTAWQAAEPPVGMTGSRFDVLYATPAGEYVLLGYAGDGTSGRKVAVRSSDGRSWQEFDSGLPADLDVGAVERGALGYLLFARGTSTTNPTLWLSSDGLTWELVQEFTPGEEFVQLDDIGAGDEGFVVFGTRTKAGVYERFAFASGDGRTWVDTRAPFGPDDQDWRFTVFVTGLGPDWVATVAEPGDVAALWYSADGITWQRSSRIDGVHMNATVDPVLVNADGTLYFSTGGETMPAVEGGAGIWSSTDGRTWQSVDIPGGVASDAASGGGTTVLTGNIAGQDGSVAAIWMRRS